jgi:hypothetical protein
MSRFAAKLLFQFRVNVDGDPGKRRHCEERIINFQARSPRDALKHARRRGRQGEFSYQNTDGNKVSFQFVGVMDLMSLGVEADAEVVWYEFRERLTPMEQRERILPKERDLLTRLSRGAG